MRLEVWLGGRYEGIEIIIVVKAGRGLIFILWMVDGMKGVLLLHVGLF